MEPVGTGTAFSSSALLLALHLVLLSALQKQYTTTLHLECSTANSTPLSTLFGTAFSTPFSTRNLHNNEVSSAKRSANLNNWRTPITISQDHKTRLSQANKPKSAYI